MNIFKLMGGILLAAILLLSCENDSFYEIPIGFIPRDEIFTDSIYAEQFVNNIYTELPSNIATSFNWMAGNSMMASATDEAMHVQKNKTSPSGATRMSAGSWGPTQLNLFRTGGNLATWAEKGGYIGIRKANVAISYLDMMPERYSERFRNRMKGEAYFLRAIGHWFLFQKWGGIPIVDKPFEASDNVMLSRNSVEEVVEFILKDCETAMKLLPMEPYELNQEVGRADRGACLALQSKVLLYAASELYNGSGFDGKSNPLICYGNYDVNRWKRAAEAAQKVVDLGWYKLYREGNDGKTNYAKLFNAWGVNTTNRELIFAHLRTPNRATESENFPAGMSNTTGGTCPSQDLVDAYEMKDGTLFDWNNLEHSKAPYANRDPRFEASIMYNGKLYKQAFNKKNYTVYTYPGGQNGQGETTSPTSYYLEKFMDYSVCWPNYGQGTTYHNWMYFRYGEILLNLAEAANEFGGPYYQVENAKSPLTPIQALDLIRERAGMPDVKTTFKNRGIAINKETLREFIRHERRIELAFEDQRYYDIRRWKLAEKLPAYIRGCEIHKIKDGFTYDPTVKVENKVFEPKHYFFPIPQVELERNLNMVQNPEWF